MIEEIDSQLLKKKNLFPLILVGNFRRLLQAVNKVVIASMKSIVAEAEVLNIDEEEAKVDKREDLINSKEGLEKDSRFKEAL